MKLSEKDRVWFARLNALKELMKLQIDCIALQTIAADQAAKLAAKKSVSRPNTSRRSRSR
jgi:hypothetical protein